MQRSIETVERPTPEFAPAVRFQQVVHPVRTEVRAGPLAGMAKQGRILLYCAVGERSTLAVEIAAEMGLTGFAHIPGGFTAWSKAGGPVEQVG